MSNTNREILFKGKRIDNGEWIKGFYVIIGGENHCIFTGRIDLTQGSIGFEYFKVDSKTVGRFTGLTDKNGRKIFEGDIIKGEGKEVFTFEYNNRTAIAKAASSKMLLRLNITTMQHYEVIGNIHDNNEQLQEKESS